MADSEPAREVRPDKEREAEERRLIEAAQRDRARFVEIYEKYFNLVYAYTARRTLNRAEAEDLTSEVFRKALENLARFKWTGAPFGAWLLRISSNLIADRAKRAGKERGSDSRVSEGSNAPRDASSPAQTQQSVVEDAERSARLF